MAHRINTRNFENGMDSRAGQTDWKKYFDRHLGDLTKSELLSFDWLGDKSALKAIEKRFEPRLIGEHLCWKNPETAQDFCCGFIDPQPNGFFLIELASEFGEHCEVVFGKKNAAARLFEIFKNSTT